MHPAVISSALLREELNPIIESKELILTQLQRSYLRARWMEQLLLMNSKHLRAMRCYYALRLATLSASLLILLLVSLNVFAHDGAWGAPTRGLAICLSLLVAACVMIEHLFNLGESHRRYERVAERLKAEGWRFLQLSGAYRSYKSHADAFNVFAGQVEALSRMDVEIYNFDMSGERKENSPVGEEESPKKLFPLESVEQMDSPAVRHRAAAAAGGQHLNHQRAQ